MLITKSSWAREEKSDCLWTSKSPSGAGSCPFPRDFVGLQGDEAQKHGSRTQPCQCCCSPGFRSKCRWGLQSVLSGPLPREHNHPPKAIREYFRNQYSLQPLQFPRALRLPPPCCFWNASSEPALATTSNLNPSLYSVWQGMEQGCCLILFYFFLFFACGNIYSWILLPPLPTISHQPSFPVSAGSFQGSINGPIKHHPCGLQPSGAEDAVTQVPYLCLWEVRIWESGTLALKKPIIHENRQILWFKHCNTLMQWYLTRCWWATPARLQCSKGCAQLGSTLSGTQQVGVIAGDVGLGNISLVSFQLLSLA